MRIVRSFLAESILRELRVRIVVSEPEAEGSGFGWVRNVLQGVAQRVDEPELSTLINRDFSGWSR